MHLVLAERAKECTANEPKPVAFGSGMNHPHGEVVCPSFCLVGQFDDQYGPGLKGVDSSTRPFRRKRCCGAFPPNPLPLCWLWKIEKRWYAGASPTAQARARSAYVALFSKAFALRRRGSFSNYLADYRQRRGMDFHHDVHDWLGGWPYESISPAQTERFMTGLGFKQVHAFTAAGVRIGLFGSGCDEYVYTRR